MGRLFGTDGIRGIANEYLSCELALSMGRALGTVLSEGNRYRPTVMIGMDTRLSSEMISQAFGAGLSSVGADVINLGVVSTPAVAYLVKKHKIRAGVMISASHNPYQYNGIKIFGGDGFKLSDELEERLESIVLDSHPSQNLASASEIGRCHNLRSAKEEYVEYLKKAFGVSLKGLRIGLDCANGSASVSAKELFSELGAECYTIADTPNGININDNCGSTSLGALRKLVLCNKLDLGIAFDGDADRCLCIDKDGCEVDGDHIMAILALKLRNDGKLSKNTVVGTIMTNFGFTKFCEKNGINYISAKVGDRYVLEMLNQEGYTFGGEQSGHIIFRDKATTGDGQLTALALLSHIKESGKTLSELAAVMKKYPQFIKNVEADENDKIAFRVDSEIRDIILEAEEKISGVGRIVVRPSGTEHLIRVMTEADDENTARELCYSVAEKIKVRLSELK